MPLFSVGGLSSGIDTQSIIDKIIEFESRPIQNLNAQIDKTQSILTSFKALEARLLAIKVDLARLTRRREFDVKATSVSDDTVINASASSRTPAGTFVLTVQQLAQSHQVASQGYVDIDTTEIGTGTFSVTVGDHSKVEIAINEDNNNLEGLANAINELVDGASATIINTGDPATPYRLLITAEDTGSSERIVIDTDLSGGTAPIFGSIAPVIPGAKTGTSTVSSSGTYTGDSNGTLTFTVESGGTIGIDNITVSYTDGADLSGSFTIPSSYTAGDDIDVYAGLKLSFTEGTLDTNDTFSVDVTTTTVQAPLDAKYALGSGESAISIVNSSNTVTSLVEGLTIDLLKVSSDPVTITIKNDLDTIKDNISSFVDQYNTFVSFMDEMLYFDAETGVAGNLLSSRTAIDIYNSLQHTLSGTVEGLGGTLDHLVEAGIRLTSDGTLRIDDSELNKILEGDLEAVKQLFAIYGESTDSNIKFLNASSATVAYRMNTPYENGYAVNITRAAERARLLGDQITAPSQSSPLVIDSSNDRLKIQVDSSTSEEIVIQHGTYTSGDDLAVQIQRQLNNDEGLSNAGIVVQFIDEGGGVGRFEFTSKSYGSGSEVFILGTSGSALYDDIGLSVGDVDVGVDVAGTINGESATGIGQILTGDDGNEYTDGLQLLVTITPDQLASQGEDQGYVKVTKGAAQRISELIETLTDTESGKLSLKQEALGDTIETYEDEISVIEARIEKKRERLLREFMLMESMIGELNSLSSMIAYGLQNIQTYSSAYQL